MNAAVAIWALWLFRAELRAVRRACRWRALLTVAALVAALRRRRPRHDAGPRTTSTRDQVVLQRDAAPTSASSSRQPRRHPPVPQRQPAVPFARRVPLPRGARPSGAGRARRAAARAGARRRRRPGGARGAELPERRARHAGRSRPAHDARCSRARRCCASSTATRCARRRCTIVNADAFAWLEASTTRRSTRSSSTSPTRPTSRSASSTRRAFYELLERHLAASGYAVVQTTSPLIARKSFWTVATTLEAAGLAATPYHAHVPSFGEWGFIVASRRPFRRRRIAAAGLRFLHRRRPAGAVRLPARHGARPGRGEPAVQPGAGADLRGRVGQGAAVSARAAKRGPTRRDVLAALAAAAPLAGCTRDDAPALRTAAGSAPAHERGHLLRDGWPATKSGAWPDAARTRRAGAIVVGAGIAGLAAARALLRCAASTTCHVLELEDGAGGNSRGHAMAGMRCPLGAHYLPVPGATRDRGARAARRARPAPHASTAAPSTTSAACATARRSASSSTAAGTRACCRRSRRCLPPSARRRSPSTARFARRGRRRGDDGALRDPDRALALERRARRARRACTFAAWLDAQGLVDAGPALVPRLLLPRRLRRRQRRRSRPGPACTTSRAGTAFTRPGDDGTTSGEARRADLARGQRLARRAPRRAAGRAPAARAASSLASRKGAHEVERRRLERGERRSASAGSRRASCSRTPLFVAARVLATPPAALREAVAPRSPCALAGRQPAARRRRSTTGPARRRRGTTSSTAAAASATSTRCTRARGRSPAATVLTAYWALGGGGDAALAEQRRRLLERRLARLGDARHRRPRAGASRPRRARCAAST